MKHWNKFLEEDPKKQIAAASNLHSNKNVAPPDFNPKSENSIQGQFKGFPGMDKTPLPAGPIPINYPNTAKSEESKDGGILSSVSSAMSGVLKDAGEFINNKTNDAQEQTTSLGSYDEFMGAVKFSHSMFSMQARFANIRIFGVSAFGGPGCLVGPNLESKIKIAPSVAKMKGKKKKMRNAVAKGVSNCFDQWKSKVMVPGLPWYPAFAAFPGPIAPPTPNIPTPLTACLSSGVPELALSKNIKKAIFGELPESMKDAATDAFVEGLALQISMYFITWLASQQVMNVLGTGPVPSFAPPTVPAGPVIAGTVISVPGHLMV